MFSIRFIERDSRRKMAKGLITFGNHREEFEASLSCWETADYQRQWSEAISRVLEGRLKSALITSMYDPELANFIFWWPMWRLRESVFIQNQLLFMKRFKGRFDSASPYRHVPMRKAASDEGDKISEWRITMDDIRRFAAAGQGTGEKGV